MAECVCAWVILIWLCCAAHIQVVKQHTISPKHFFSCLHLIRDVPCAA